MNKLNFQTVSGKNLIAALLFLLLLISLSIYLNYRINVDRYEKARLDLAQNIFNLILSCNTDPYKSIDTLKNKNTSEFKLIHTGSLDKNHPARKKLLNSESHKTSFIINEKGRKFLYCFMDKEYESSALKTDDYLLRIPFNPKIHNLMHNSIIYISLPSVAGLLILLFMGLKLRAAQKALKEQAVIDTLTGIPNRKAFTTRIMEELKRGKRDKYPISIIIGDIDDFKSYNEIYGQQYGDECLKKIADTISSCLKRPGDFCARYAGEEFIIILPSTQIKGAEFIANEIIRKIKRLDIKHSGSNSGYISVSMGISMANHNDETDYGKLIIQAETAMLHVKGMEKHKIEVFEGERN